MFDTIHVTFNIFEPLLVSYVLNIILAFVIIFLERKDPIATLAWLLVLSLLPGVGFILYIFLSQNFSRKKMFKMKANAQKKFGDFLNIQQEEFNSEKLVIKDRAIIGHRDIIKMNLFRNQAFFTQNNDVQIFTDGQKKFDELFKCIENAKESVHIQYYIIKYDDLGKKLISLLEKKAKEGVEVRLLYDCVGSRRLLKRHVRNLINAGGRTGRFFPSFFRHMNLKINYRNHRKIVVIDGQIGFVGGFNVGNEYLGLKKRFGYWRDTHIKITGLAVTDLQKRFFLDWSNATREDLNYQPKYFPQMDENDGPGDVAVQIITSGPDQTDEIIKQNYIKLINSAQESILIQTPYFVPDSSVMEAIKIAASSGVDVRIMIPNMPDHMFVYWATYYNIGELLKYGVKVYTYEKGFLHAKTLVIDGTVSTVGTANFDVRSFKLNFEIIAIIYDTLKSTELKRIFEEDTNYSLQITPELYMQRGITIRIKESISRLLSPLL